MDLNQIKKAVNIHRQDLILPDAPRFTAVLMPFVERVGLKRLIGYGF